MTNPVPVMEVFKTSSFEFSHYSDAPNKLIRQQPWRKTIILPHFTLFVIRFEWEV